MIMSAHQPAYLPWLGYFDKIKRSDVFVFLDTVQYEKNSFTNRNKIKTANGPVWLSIPVIKKNHFEKKMNEIVIDSNYNWQKKHLNAIKLAYSRAKNFNLLFPKLEKLYEKKRETLVETTLEHLEFWLDVLEIDTKIVLSSELGVNSKKSDLVLDLCKSVGADYYISGPMGKDYLKLDKFDECKINVEIQDYTHPVYKQLYGDFIPNMGIIDFVMNCEDYSII